MVKHSFAPEWSYHETKKRLFHIPDTISRDFAIISYCLGARLNEIREHLRPKDINFITLPNGEPRIIATVYTEKNPHLAYRNVPLNPKNEPEYAQVLLEWKEHFEENPDIFPFKKFTARTYQQKIRTFLDIHHHALRHLRVHHVDDNSIPGMKALTPRQFKDFFGWERIETSAYYQSRTRATDLAERM